MSEIKGTPVKFKIGGQADYEGITKDDNVIYFTTDSDGNHRIYVGDDCYNVTVIETDLDSAVMSTKTVPSTQATKEALNGKVSRSADGTGFRQPVSQSLPRAPPSTGCKPSAGSRPHALPPGP